MKKATRIIWCVLACIAWLLLCIVIGVHIGPDKVNYSLTLVDEVKDKYDNILQQIYYNDNTDEYLIKEYSYSLQKNKWLCTNQHTTVVPFGDTTSKYESSIDNSLKIFYDKDFTNGPIVIMDNEDIKISIVKTLATDSWYYFGYELKIVNKSNKVLSVVIDEAAIMDRQCKPLFNVEHVDIGHTVYFDVAWQKEELERCHIPHLDNIEFMIKVFDNDNWKEPAMYGNKILMKIGD